MLQKGALVVASLVFGFAVLFTSIVRTTSPQYVFSENRTEQEATPSVSVSEIDYYLPYPGILPDHFLWPVKALRDRVKLFVVIDPVKKAEVALLLADKRVGMARELIRGGKAELGVSTLTKAEKYLKLAFEEEEKARAGGRDTVDLLTRLAKASLKHQEVIESVMQLAPEEARPILVQTMDGYKRVYDRVAQILQEEDVPVPGISPLPSPSPSPTPAIKMKK